MDRVRTAVVGTGGIFHGWGGGSGRIPAYTWVEEAKLAALCDVSAPGVEQAAAALRKAFHEKAVELKAAGNADAAERLERDAGEVKTYTDYAEMLAKEKLDLVDICAPASAHAAVSIAALNAGASVLCEKPTARTWLEAEAIASVVAKTKKLFMLAENIIFGDEWYTIKKCLAAGMIGEPMLIHIPFAIGGPGAYSYVRDKVGALLDVGSHAAITAWYLFGFETRPVRVRAVAPHGIGVRIRDRMRDGVPAVMDVEDDAHFMVEYEAPGTGRWFNAFVEASWSFRDSDEMYIIGTSGVLRSSGGIKITDPFGHVREIKPWRGSWLHQQPPPGTGGYPQEVRHICHCIRHGVKPLCDERVASESMALLGAAYLSQARGMAAVTLDEFKGFAHDIQRKEGARASEVLLQEMLAGVRQ